MKRILTLLLALALLSTPALAGDDDALGLYTELSAEQTAAEEEAAAAILAKILLPDMTDGEKALALHDWLVLNTVYSLDKYRDMDYGAVVRHEAICRGYARGFVYLAERAGLESIYTFSPELIHSWALTKLDGSFYCADPTWDDNHYERIGFVNHRHFLFSTEAGRALNHYGEDTALIADGGIYESAPWRDAVTQVIFLGEYMYFINRDFELIACERRTWDCTVLLRCLSHWEGFWEDYDESLEAISTGLVLRDGRLWFNTPHAVFSILPDGSSLHCEYENDGAAGYLCGLAEQDGRLVVSVSAVCKTRDYQLLEIN